MDCLIEGVAKATTQMAEQEKDDALAAYHGAPVDHTKDTRSAASDEPLLRLLELLVFDSYGVLIIVILADVYQPFAV